MESDGTLKITTTITTTTSSVRIQEIQKFQSFEHVRASHVL